MKNKKIIISLTLTALVIIFVFIYLALFSKFNYIEYKITLDTSPEVELSLLHPKNMALSPDVWSDGKLSGISVEGSDTSFIQLDTSYDTSGNGGTTYQTVGTKDFCDYKADIYDVSGPYVHKGKIYFVEKLGLSIDPESVNSRIINSICLKNK